MARVTVEDCLKNVKNRFELVILAAKRARQLMHGKEATVEWDNDKATVVALREIAAGHTDFDQPDQADDDHMMNIRVQEKIVIAVEEDDEDENDAQPGPETYHHDQEPRQENSTDDIDESDEKHF